MATLSYLFSWLKVDWLMDHLKSSYKYTECTFRYIKVIPQSVVKYSMHMLFPVYCMPSLNWCAVQCFANYSYKHIWILFLTLTRLLVWECLEHSALNISQNFLWWVYFFCFVIHSFIKHLRFTFFFGLTVKIIATHALPFLPINNFIVKTHDTNYELKLQIQIRIVILTVSSQYWKIYT
jgi:hypothetical protein